MRRSIGLTILSLENHRRELKTMHKFSPKGSLSYQMRELRIAWTDLKIEILKVFL